MTGEKPDELTIDRVTSGWCIAQRLRGHRHSTDDLLTGWYAAEHSTDAKRLLDLGSGIGTVGLLALWRSPNGTLTAVEAQEVSFQLLLKNIEMNQLESRVRAIHGDLREVRFPGETFDLVTGSPPYFDVKAGIVPIDSQKAHAKFELRGDVRDYCIAARAAMSPGARFVFCFPTPQRQRADRAIKDADLALLSSCDVIPKRGTRPLFSLFNCCRTEDRGELPTVIDPPHIVREEDGTQTEQHGAARATFGMGI